MKRRTRDQASRWFWAIFLTGGIAGLLLAGTIIMIHRGSLAGWLRVPPGRSVRWFESVSLYSTIGRNPVQTGEAIRLGDVCVFLDWTRIVQLCAPDRQSGGGSGDR
jgi:hypothetical protein